MLDKDVIEHLVALVEWLAFADGLVTKEEALKIALHVGVFSGHMIWDVSQLPESKQKTVLKLIEQLHMGTHPALLESNYKPAREGEDDPGLPWITTELH